MAAFATAFIAASMYCGAAMPIHDQRVTIAPGVDMPLISNGACFFGQPGSVPEDPRETIALDLWLARGGRGIDTAWNYNNQRVVGWAIDPANTTVNRSDIFLTTKIPCLGTEEAALSFVKKDIAMLGTTPDLIIIHSPGFVPPAPIGQPSGCWGFKPCCQDAAALQATWRGLEAALKQRLTRAIGVSNQRKQHLQIILANATVVPAINQCQMYVGVHDDEAIAFGQRHGVTYEAYSPLGPWSNRNHKPKPVLSNPTVLSIAHAHNVSAAQVGMRWIAQQGHALVTATASEEYDDEDLSIFDFNLTSDEMNRLSDV